MSDVIMSSGLGGLGAILGLLILFMIIIVIASIFYRKSLFYRKVLADLYVAGKIREIAKDDGIDLAIEYESFKKFCKKENITNQELDTSIEKELQEKMTDKEKEKK